MKTVFEAIVRDTNNKLIPMARIQNVKLIPLAGKKVRVSIEVIE